MDRRRNRRGRGHSHINRTGTIPSNLFSPPQTSKTWLFLNGLSSFLIMTSLIALIYLMLEFHCSNCKDRCQMNNVTRSIESIAKNLSIIRDGYYDLEMKISKFSQDLPKLEGQIDILEALANTMEKCNLGWDPKSHLTLPGVDVYLNKRFNVPEKNISSRKCCIPPPIPKAVETQA